MGYPDAPVLVELFTDFECRFCAEVHRSLVGLARQYPARVRLEHHDYPLDQSCNPAVGPGFHTHACRAARFARCAARQGRFWDFTARVFDDQSALSADDLLDHGRQLGLDLEALAVCVDQAQVSAAIQDDIRLGSRRGVTGTPTAFLSLRGQAPERITGLRPREVWEERVERLIDRANHAPARPARARPPAAPPRSEHHPAP